MRNVAVGVLSSFLIFSCAGKSNNKPNESSEQTDQTQTGTTPSTPAPVVTNPPATPSGTAAVISKAGENFDLTNTQAIIRNASGYKKLTTDGKVADIQKKSGWVILDASASRGGRVHLIVRTDSYETKHYVVIASGEEIELSVTNGPVAVNERGDYVFVSGDYGSENLSFLPYNANAVKKVMTSSVSEVRGFHLSGNAIFASIRKDNDFFRSDVSMLVAENQSPKDINEDMLCGFGDNGFLGEKNVYVGTQTWEPSKEVELCSYHSSGAFVLVEEDNDDASVKLLTSDKQFKDLLKIEDTRVSRLSLMSHGDYALVFSGDDMWAVNTSGVNKKIIDNQDFFQFTVINDSVYYNSITDGIKSWKVNIKTGAKEEVKAANSPILQIIGLR